MGELDLIKPYIELKGQIFFGRLNMKPGKPTTFGRIGNCLVLALPGNPVSCFVTASLFFDVLVNAVKEGTQMQKCIVEAQLLPKSVKVDPIRPEYHRCTVYRFGGKFVALSTGANLQQSSRLLSAVNASGLAFLPAGSGLYECKGKTKVVLLEQNISKLKELSQKQLTDLEKQNQSQSIMAANTSCSGACAQF